jgi:outer membrane protein TolC
MKLGRTLLWLAGIALLLRAAASYAAAPSGARAELLDEQAETIDLAGALRLAGANNPAILQARQRILEAVYQRRLAAVQLLPNLNFGGNYHDHNGMLQQSTGNIVKGDLETFYLGAGAGATGAGTVAIPGIVWLGNPSIGILTYLESRQTVAARRAESRAVEGQIVRQVGGAYLELLRAEGNRSLAALDREQAKEAQRLVEDHGRQADRARAATVYDRFTADLREAEGAVRLASNRLAALLNLDPSLRLTPDEAVAVPSSLVPDPIPLRELLALALLYRPELAQQRAIIRQAVLKLHGAKLLPFASNFLIGGSMAGEAGGSNLVAEPIGTTPFFARNEPRFGNMMQRADFDAVIFWAVQNLGVANRAMVREARSHVNMANQQLLEVLATIRTEVASAHARCHVRFAQIENNEQAVRSARAGYVTGKESLPKQKEKPVELLDSLRLLAQARRSYLRAIVDYNEAQVDLFVALGMPPADTLARPAGKK